MSRTLSVIVAPVVLSGVLAATASSGDGIKMRSSPGVCGPACKGDRRPAWSPDGKRIAFVRWTRRGSPRTIFVTPSSGGRVSRVLDSPGQSLPDVLVWSPDSSRLAFQSMSARIFFVPAAGGEMRSLSPPVAPGPGLIADRPPVWSPDGRFVAFVRYLYAGRFEPPSVGWCCQLWVASADGSGARLFGGGPRPRNG
jgi:Tol biopolymer transport system component